MGSSKAILWAIIFLLTAIIYIIIPTISIVAYWPFLATLTIEGNPVYTYALLFLFVWIITLIVSLIYIVAMLRAIIQRKNEDLGIPHGVKYFGGASVIGFAAFFIIWYLLFQQIAFIALIYP